MKTKLFLVSVIFIVMTACSVGRVSEAQVYASVYTKIPLAPNVVLTVETPIYSAPGPNYVWIDGYWSWDNYYREYVWVQAYWAVAPYVNAYWIPGYWESYRNGYRWIDACWLPRDYRLNYGYYSGRYDYYGRPVYYHQPGRESRYAYTYSYDHRPEYRDKGYSSSPRFNETPKSERNRITSDYQKQSTNSRSSSSTTKSRQETIKIRTDNDSQRGSGSSATPGRTSNGTDNRRPEATTTPGRTQSEPRQSTTNPSTNTRQQNSTNNNNSTTRGGDSPQVRSNSSNTNSNSNSRQDQSGNSRSSGSSSNGRGNQR
jgi:hypothetical protein